MLDSELDMGVWSSERELKVLVVPSDAKSLRSGSYYYFHFCTPSNKYQAALRLVCLARIASSNPSVPR